jgi:cytochrome c556
VKPTKLIPALAIALSLSLSALTVSAQAQDAVSAAIKARQAQMALYAFNLGQLGAMAKGAVDYDADAAKAAAGNLVKLTSLSGGAMWLPGSDDMSADKTRALPAIWENFPDVAAKSSAVAEAAVAMEAASGNGLDALRGAIGPLGGACGACHKAYRAPE